MPKAIFYLLNGDYEGFEGFGFEGCSARFCLPVDRVE